jgi:hypothetical protein
MAALRPLNARQNLETQRNRGSGGREVEIKTKYASSFA